MRRIASRSGSARWRSATAGWWPTCSPPPRRSPPRASAPAAKVAIRASSLTSGHSYANWVAHLAAMHLGASHVSIVETASLSAAVQAGMIDAVIGPRTSLSDIPATLKAIEFDCDPSKPLAAPAEAPPSHEQSAVRLNLTSGTTGKPKFLAWDQAMIERRAWRRSRTACRSAPTRSSIPCSTSAPRPASAIRWRCGRPAAACCCPRARSRPTRDREALGPSTLIAASPVQLSERVRLFPDPWDGRDQRTIIVLGGRLPARGPRRRARHRLRDAADQLRLDRDRQHRARRFRLDRAPRGRGRVRPRRRHRRNRRCRAQAGRGGRGRAGPDQVRLDEPWL